MLCYYLIFNCNYICIYIYTCLLFNYRHDKHLNYILYTLDESEDGKRIDNPSWITFDHSVPYLEALPPKNLSDLSAVYTLRVMAMTAENQEIAEEELILVVAHSCFKKCPKHFGIGCEDWELWMIMAGIYGFFLLIVGWCLHGCIVALWERNLNAHRKQFMEQNTDPRERALMIEKDFYFDDDLDWNGKKKKTKCQKCLRNVQYFIWTKVLVLRPK